MDIRINNHITKTPEHINDLSDERLLQVFETIYTDNRSGFYTPDQLTDHIKMVLICIVCAIPEKMIVQMKAVDILKLEPTIEFLFDSREENDGTKSIFLKQNLTRTPPKFKVKGITYYGPSNEIGNLSIYEFALADGYMIQYTKTGQSTFLDMMIATLFRPSKSKSKKEYNYGGDRRVDIDSYEHMIEKRSRLIGKKLDRIQKTIILHYFISSRKELFERYPIPTSSESDGDGFGYAGLIISLAGDKFGDADQTGRTNISTILIHLSMVEKQREQDKINRAIGAM